VFFEERAIGERAPLVLLANAILGRLELAPTIEVRVQRRALREEPRDPRSRVARQATSVEPLREALAERRLATDSVSAPSRRVLELLENGRRYSTQEGARASGRVPI